MVQHLLKQYMEEKYQYVAPMHACVNSFIHNPQRWFLYSPDLKPIFDPNVSTLDWLYEVYPMIDQKPLECVLHPGEVNIFLMPIIIIIIIIRYCIFHATGGMLL